MNGLRICDTNGYVNEWSHLGHIISANCDDKSDIISRRNTLCGQINNVLCYFGICQSLVINMPVSCQAEIDVCILLQSVW